MRQRSRLAASALAAIALASSFALMERDARACGGCFSPSENPTVVTDHRMILSIAQDQSTLYDQIEYTGSPSSFAWVLPISGTVDVGLSANIVFQALDGMTQTQINPPPLNCPAAPNCGSSLSVNATAPTAGGEDGAEDAGVAVIKTEQVGPYETVQLQATDPQALENWLATNGFNVPADVQPVVDQYVAEKFNFLALKLIPGKDVTDMRPVRVTTLGANAVLPLRMVSAGTGATVGISLWIVAEGRYEPQNFPTFHIDTQDISWDWTLQKSDYTEIRATKEAALGGKGWEIESATLLTPDNLTQAVINGYYFSGGPGGFQGTPDPDGQQNYLPVMDDQGNVTKTAQQVRDEDLATLFHNVSSTNTHVTRMRSDLAHAALSADLIMNASADQSELSNIRLLTKESNEPQCPVYDGCEQVGTAPRSQAAAETNANASNESMSCSTAPGAKAFRTATSPGGLGTIGISAGFLALSIIKSRRRRA